MTNKVMLVTPPDDILSDALRILVVGLNQSQSQMLSDCLTRFDEIPDTVIYLWNDQSAEWLFDKKAKCDLIVFNANIDKQELVGYLTAQTNSYYFGILKTLDIINNRAIFDTDQLYNLILTAMTSYSKKIS